METTDRLESLLAHSPAVLYACRPAGDFGATYISPNVSRQVGYGAEEFLADPSFWASRIHPDDAPRVFANLSSLFERGSHSHEYRFLHEDGRWRWMRDDLTLVRDASGEPVEIVGAWVDVTERREAEEALRDSEELCRTVFDAASDGIILVEPATRRILRANSTFARMLGREAEGIAGLGIEAIHPPDRLGEVLRGFERHARGEAVHDEDVPVLRADGSVFPAEVDTSWIRLKGRPYMAGFFRDLTQRRRAEEERALRERDYRTLFDATGDAIFILDAAGNFLDANRAACERYGYSREEMLALNVRRLNRAEDRSSVEERLARVAGGGAVFETVHVRKDGSPVPVEVNSRLVEYGGRSVYFSIVRDLSERKQAEEERARRDRDYRTLFDATSDAIFILDTEGGFLDANRAAHERLGYTREELLALHVRDIDPPEDVPKIPDRLARISRPGGAVFEAVHVRKDGSRMPVEVNSRKGEYGGREVFLSIVRDLTERKEAEERLRVIFEASQAGILLVDPAGTIVLANDRMAEMLRLPLDRLVGTTYPEHLHPDERAAGDERMRALIAGGIRAVATERRYLRADGTDFWGYLSGKRIENPDGSLKALVGVVADITERKESERERLELERRLLHVQKLESLGVLAGGIAHDFNNLLMAVLGNLDLALARTSAGSPARESIELSAQAARRATDLTRQMLAYSGQGRFLVQPLDLNALVEENAHLFRASIDRSASLHLRLERPLPWIEGDPGQLQQVVMNLLLNASDALGGKAGAITLSTGVEACDARRLGASRLAEAPSPGRFVHVEVADTGAGMDEAVQQRIFDPFFTTKRSGRGLGMSAILGIVRGHGGAIFVESAPGRGTAIRVAFPLRGDGGEEGRADASEAPGGELSLGGAVLVVDDEESVRAVCREMVRHLGCPVLEAADGREAVALFRERGDGIAVVLLDLSMPGLNGVETMGEILALRPGAKVLLSSGYDRSDAVRDYEGAGAAGFIQKPYSLEGLRRALREAAGRD